jgi:LacI family transcriptional regulator
VRQKKISQDDVARLAGVSTTTVSIVLNGKQDALRIAPETVARIHRAMAELRYRPNAMAQALVHGRTNTIGVVLGRADMAYFTNAYYGPAIQGIVGEAFSKRRFVLLYHGGELGAADLDVTQYMDGRCDGLILTPPFSIEKYATPLVEAGFPFVTLGDASENPHFPGVDIDNEAAARAAARHLMQNGHRHILMLVMSAYPNSALEGRRTGCRAETEEQGGIYSEAFLPRNDEAGMRDLLKQHLSTSDVSRPTGLVCLTDEIALTVILVLRDLGLEVPRDVSVVGFDDIPAATTAGLTTIRQDPIKLGEAATCLLLQLIDNEHTATSTSPPTRVLLPIQLVERNSVAFPPP